MLLTISAEVSEGDLGYLLHKNPSRLHSFDLPFGQAHVFYPERSWHRSQAALLLDVDPIGLVRGKGKISDFTLHQYVNDRPYAASSFLSVAISRVLGTAMSGRSKERQHLADQPMPLEAVITALPCRGGEAFLRGLFEPLGYEVAATHYYLDEAFPEWGPGPYYTVRLKACIRLRDLLTHIYVLVPVLDAEKHYWVGADEVDKLLEKGEGWLAAHPQRDTIVARYLRYHRELTHNALARLADEGMADPESEKRGHTEEELAVEAPLQLWEERIAAALSVLRSLSAQTVIDLGCGEGRLLKPLLEERSLERIVGMDVSWRALQIAHRRLRFDELPAAQKSKIELIQGSLMYRDSRLSGFDAAVVMEVIEHLDPPRLAAFERVVFEAAQPKAILLTTPNIEYNSHFPFLPAGHFRHKDHRFEWTRSEFQAWGAHIASQYGYKVRFLPVGPEDSITGAPTQMGVFEK